MPTAHASSPAEVYPLYVTAFNAGDVDATVACYERSGCFVAKSGRAARGPAELREVYRNTFANKPFMEVSVRKILPAGDDLALVVVSWKAKAVTSTGENKTWGSTATDIVRRQSDGTWKLVLDNPHGIE